MLSNYKKKEKTFSKYDFISTTLNKNDEKMNLKKKHITTDFMRLKLDFSWHHLVNQCGMLGWSVVEIW
jgi:hypothetical protein